MKNRRSKLIRSANKINCDTVVAFEPENLFYMTGFWGEAIGILEKNGQTTIIAPELEVDRAKEESTDCKVVTSERGTALLSHLAEMIKWKKPVTDCQNYTIMQSLKKSIPPLKHSAIPFYDARVIKESKEISILKKASKIIDEIFTICTEKLKKGQKESELQSILMSYAIKQGMFDTGYRSTLNPLIIAGGPNGALPHAQITNRRFSLGDLVVVDLTLRYKGYVSDATRTFGVGKIPEDEKEVYHVVQESQKLGLRAVKPNKSCKSVDYACRKYIEEKGLGKFFIHSTGHGIGLEVHEQPTISSQSTTNLKKDMAITVEPGIYIPKKFGIRIEDSIIVKERPIVLHRFTKDLITI